MRVLIASEFCVLDESAPAKRVRFLGESLHGRAEVRILGRDGTLASDFSQEPTLRQAAAGVVSPLASGGIGRFFVFLRTISAMKPILETELEGWKPDIVLAYTWSELHLRTMLRVCRARNTPLVVDVVEWPSWSYFRGGLFNPYFWNVELFMRLSSLATQGVVAIAGFLREYYVSAGLPCLYIPAITRVPVQPPPPPERNGRLRLTYVGTGDARDCLPDLCCAVDRLNAKCFPTTLNIVGRLAPSRERLFAHLGRLGVKAPDCLNVTGWLDPGKYAELCERTDAFVILRRPGRTSVACFPTRLAEFMARGRPVVVTNVGDLPLYVKHGVHGVAVDYGDWDRLLSGVMELLGNPEHCRKMGHSCWEVARNSFDFQKYGQPLAAFLASLKCRRIADGQHS